MVVPVTFRAYIVVDALIYSVLPIEHRPYGLDGIVVAVVFTPLLLYPITCKLPQSATYRMPFK